MINNVNDSEGLKLKSQVYNILQQKQDLKKQYESLFVSLNGIVERMRNEISTR